MAGQILENPPYLWPGIRVHQSLQLRHSGHLEAAPRRGFAAHVASLHFAREQHGVVWRCDKTTCGRSTQEEGTRQAVLWQWPGDLIEDGGV